MRTGQIAGIPDVDLHGVQRSALQQLGVVDARSKRRNAKPFAALLQIVQGESGCPTRKRKCPLRPLKVVAADMGAGGRDAKMRRVAAVRKQRSHVAGDGHLAPLDAANLAT